MITCRSKEVADSIKLDATISSVLAEAEFYHQYRKPMLNITEQILTITENWNMPAKVYATVHNNDDGINYDHGGHLQILAKRSSNETDREISADSLSS